MLFPSVYFEYLLRILVAAVCGLVIGFERKNRKKEAGIRTHMIVALASALMMIVSKYGFSDITAVGDIRLDPSRVASQIVCGVGFLGAGMIFVQKKIVRGLTTAAGVWATCGIGMAVGAGMYFIGISAAAVIFVIQIILHKDFKIFKSHMDEQLTVIIKNNSESLIYTQNILRESDTYMAVENIIKLSDELLLFEIDINNNSQKNIGALLRENDKNENIVAIFS